MTSNDLERQTLRFDSFAANLHTCELRKGDRLGTITDPMSNARSEIRSPYSGRVIGMARNQIVMPGFAAFHVGIATVEAPVDDTEPAVAKKSESKSDDYVDGMSE